MISRFLVFLGLTILIVLVVENNDKSLILHSTIGEKIKIDGSILLNRESAITRSIKRVSPSVVGINVTQLRKGNTKFLWDSFFPPYSHTYKVDNLGSGVIMSKDGYVITNAHVVEDADQIIVTLNGGDRFEAKLIGIDNLTDVALLKIDGQDLPFADLGNSDNLMVGEWAIALGNPLGLFDISHTPTATAGIISGVDVDFGLKEEGHVYQDMIQTDASINSGNSGGPLVNTLGHVIGINTFILTGSDYLSGSIGIGFSIPINRVKEVVDDLKLYGKVERSYNTGIYVQEIDKYIQKYLRLPDPVGVLVRDVEKKSSGYRSGLQIGDVILKVDGRTVRTPKDIIRVIDEGFRKVGDIVKLTVWRNESILELLLELEESKLKKWGFK